MTHEVRGVVARSKGEAVSVETVLVPGPGPGEALVAVQACGVCHTDLHYREGGIGDDYPYLLGHEAAGIVEEVGEASPKSLPATTSSSTGERSAASVGPAARASPGTASTPTTRTRR